MGLVPKSNGKTRLIFHLSYDFGGTNKSVNSYAPKELCTVKYNDWDHAVKNSLSFRTKPIFYGRTDFSNAFRLLPVERRSRRWLLSRAEDPETGEMKFFVEKNLSFGHSISCSHFTKFSNAMRHIIIHLTGNPNTKVTNYLDDFLFMDKSKQVCNSIIRRFVDLCKYLNVPLAADKTIWATSKIVFLGLLLNGEQLKMGIPTEKKLKAKNMLMKMKNSRKSTVKELQRLSGFLNFLNRAVLPGRAFTRSMYDAIKGKIEGKALKGYHHVNLPAAFKSDCETWLKFLQDEEDNSPIFKDMVDIEGEFTGQELDFYTDASASLETGAFGCVFGKNWTFNTWGEEFMKEKKPSINFLEMAALCIGIFTWRDLLRNKRTILFCDNTSVRDMVNDFFIEKQELHEFNSNVDCSQSEK